MGKKGIQLATGHGFLESYFQRFRLRETNGMCECGEIEDGEHVREHCMIERRVVARNVYVTRLNGSHMQLRENKTVKKQRV